jgi:hypothetical protein
LVAAAALVFGAAAVAAPRRKVQALKRASVVQHLAAAAVALRVTTQPRVRVAELVEVAYLLYWNSYHEMLYYQ